jgi:hypothetical protein
VTSQHIPQALDLPAPPRIGAKGRRNNVGRAMASFLSGASIAAGFLSFVPALSAQAGTNPVSRSFDFSYVIRVVPPQTTHTMRVWVPVPSSDQFQTISQMRVTAPAKIRMRKDSKYGDRYAYFSVDGSRFKTPFEIRLAFHVIRYERRMDLTPADVGQKPFPKEVIPFLRPDQAIPLDGATATLAAEQLGGLTDPLEKAHRIYEYLISTVRGAPQANDVQPDTTWAVDKDKSNCADFHALFVGMARAAGIPARFETGFSIPEEQKEGAILSYHSWAEFYVNGIGWIPVDALQGGRAADGSDSLFGAIDAGHVTLSTGGDVPVTPSPKTGPLSYGADPYIEADGKPYSQYSTTILFNESGIAAPRTSNKLIFAVVRPDHWRPTGSLSLGT